MKKILFLVILGFAVIGVLVWLVNYLSTGTIIVTANEKGSTITLQRTSQGKPFVKIGLGSLSVTATHGQYLATIKNGSQVIEQFINFNDGHKTLKYSISLSSLSQVEPVAYQNASDVAASNTGLVYLDAGDEYIHTIDNQNNLVAINSAQQFQNVKWANASFGVGLDSDGHLYTINNASISPLAVPFSYGGKAVSFDVSENKQIYVSYGEDVYVGGQNGSFKKIYTATSSNLVLAAGVNKVAIADETEEQSASNPLLATVSTSGSVIKNVGEGEIGKLALSPNGQYLVSVNESYASVYDSSLHQVAIVPAISSVNYVTWLDNNRFFYTSGDELWLYDLTNQRAELVASMPFLVNSITGLSISSDRSYVYLTASVSGLDNNAVLRVGLKGQQVPDYMNKLQGIIPLMLSDCSLSLVNFVQPTTILVTPFPNSNLSPQAYLQEAQNELQQDGFDLSKLQFKLVAGS